MPWKRETLKSCGITWRTTSKGAATFSVTRVTALALEIETMAREGKTQEALNAIGEINGESVKLKEYVAKLSV